MATGTIKTKTPIQGCIDTSKKAQGIASEGGTGNHERLTNREAPNQHPISAITNLTQILADKLDASTAQPLINDAINHRAAGLYFDAYKEFGRKSYWYLTSMVDPVTGQGLKTSIIAGPYDLGAGGGSGGGGSASGGGISTITLSKIDPLTNVSMWPSATAIGAKCEIGVNWSSIKEEESTGNGTLYIYVNDILISKKTYPQGIVNFDITNNIISGVNKIEVKVIDAYSTTKNLIANITGVTLQLESTFDASIAYTGTILYTYKAFGDVDKTVHFLVDDVETGTSLIKTTGETSNYIITGLTHGAHKLAVYFTAQLDGATIISNTLRYDLIYVVPGDNTPIIASVFPEISEQEQYVAFNIPYRVHTPSLNNSSVTLYVNGIQLGDALSIDQSNHVWTYRPLDVGDYILKIKTGEIEKIFNVHANTSRVNVETVTTSLALALDVEGRSNAETLSSRVKWEDTVHGVSCVLSGFNWSSNGWMTDTNGNPILRVAGSARVEIPYKPFERDFTQTGKTFEFEIATRDVKAYDSMIIQCLDGGDSISKSVWLSGEDDRTKKFTITDIDNNKFLEAINHEYGSYVFTYTDNTWKLDNLVISDADLLNVYGLTMANIDLDSEDPDTNYYIEGDRFNVEYKVVGMGFYITPQLAKLQAQQTSLNTQYKEEDNVRLTFVIENRREHRLVYMYINGVMSGVTVYPTSETFRQAVPQNITIGSSDATIDIYNLRIYDTALSSKQVVNNWIADTQDVILKSDRYYNNDNYDETGNITINKLPGKTPYLVITAEKLPAYKKDKKPVQIEFVYPIDSSRDFIAENAIADVQGTSSQYYYIKNFKIKYENGFINNDDVVNKHYKICGDSSKKEKTFTYKADVASSEGTNNVELVRYFEDTKNWYAPPELNQDPEDTLDGYDTADRIRVGIDGFPIVTFFNDGVNGIKFYAKMNFNNDKANDRTFGFIEGDESWEITNNSNQLVLFQNDDMSDWQNSFESRFPEDVEDVNGVEHPYGTQPGELDKLSNVISWIVSTKISDDDSPEIRANKLARFKAELPIHFDVTSSLFYYLFTELFLMADSRAKNAMLTYYKSRRPDDGGDKWFWIPYDMDTALGINNEGLLVFDYDVEDTDLVHGANVYNGQKSVFWNNIREAFPDELREMYADLRANVWSFDTIEQRYEDHQAVWSESIFNQDSYRKYLEPLIINNDASYLGMAQGSKAQQRRWWLFNRFRYLDSKYRTGDAAAQHIMLRVYQRGDLTITPYINCHVTAIYDQAVNYVTVDAEKNRPILLQSPEGWDPAGSDAVLSIYSADMLKDVGDLSTFKPGYANFSAATKLQTLKIGSTEPGYTNAKLTGIMVGNNHLLTEIDARNCTNLGAGEGSEVTSTIDLSNCISIEKAYFDNTKILGVQFPIGGYLTTVHLPSTITMLEIRNHPNLTELVLDGTENIQSLWLENISSEAIDAYNIVSRMTTGCSVRLIGIDCTFENANQIQTFYDKLDTMVGKDIHGDYVERAQVTGTISLSYIAYADYIALSVRYPEIIIRANTVICNVNFYNGDVVFDSQQIYVTDLIEGAPANDPVLEIGNPQKARTEKYYYQFESWDAGFTAVRSDMTINAIFSEHIREFQITYDTQSGAIASPDIETVRYDEFSHMPILSNIPELTEFMGWYKDNGTLFDFNTPIRADITLYAHWRDNAAPTIIVTHESFNKFHYRCTDNVGIAYYKVTNTETVPDEWSTVHPVEQLFEGDYTVNAPGNYYLYVRDASNNPDYIVHSGIQVNSVNITSSTGITDVIVTDFETEERITSYAVTGSVLKIQSVIDSHYAHLKLTINGTDYFDDLGEIPAEGFVITSGEDLTISVTCEPKVYVVTFDNRGRGVKPPVQTVTYLHQVVEPAPQSLDEASDVYIIRGWYRDTSFLIPWDFEIDVVTDNIILYALWVPSIEPSKLTVNITADNLTITTNLTQTWTDGTELDWGDGTPVIRLSTGIIQATHTYEEPGTYIIRYYRILGRYYLGGSSPETPVIVPITALTEIELSPDITTTNSYAFANAINITNAGISRFITVIAEGAYYNCNNLTTFYDDETPLQLPTNIIAINNYAFMNCSRLAGDLIIPQKATTLGNEVFRGCSSISSATILSNITKLNRGLFSGTGITTITFQDTINTIENSCFENCTALTNITIPNSVTTIGDMVFAGCINLEKIILNCGQDATYGNWCFNNCYKLNSIGPIGSNSSIEYSWVTRIPDKVFSFETNTSYIYNIRLRNEITHIGNSAFAYCENVTQIILPDNVIFIGATAFYNCFSLTRFEIPEYVTHIGNGAFTRCWGMHDIYIYCTTNDNLIESLSQLIFTGCFSLKAHVMAIPSIQEANRVFGSLWANMDESRLIDVEIVQTE